jgi:transcriptional regulator with XRE-family HTH domain
MRKDVQARIRGRIRARLEELGMTARELARAVGHDDAWISGILKGSQGLHWKDFDAVAAKLDISPSELVRLDDTNLRELTPSEMALLRHYQTWPTAIRDRWLDILDHFAAGVPDKDTATLLEKLRSTPKSLRRPVLAWLSRLLEEGIPPEAITGGVEWGVGEATPERATTRRGPPGRK